MKLWCWILAVSMAALSHASVSAQGVEKEAQGLKVSYVPGARPEDAVNLVSLALRPNIAQPVSFYYTNQFPGIKKNVKITLEQVSPDNKTKVIGTTTLPMVKSKETVPVVFAPPGAPAPPVIPGAKGDAKDVWPALAGPPFMLRFVVEEGKVTSEKRVPVTFLEPRDYVTASGSYDTARRRLSVNLRWKREAEKLPCLVELDLQPSVIPGLVQPKTGTFLQTLSEENQAVELTAENVSFSGDGPPPPNGRVYVTVDGYKRAFMFKCTFSEGTLVLLRDEMRARLVTPRYSLPGPKVAVTLEVDAKNLEEGEDDSPQRSLVELKFDRIGDGRNYDHVPRSPFKGLREQAVGYKFEEGVFFLRTAVNDRVVELNTLGINGRRSLQVRLLTAKGAPISLANEQELGEKVALFSREPENRFAPLRFVKDKDAVLAELVLDASPPEDLKFDNLPEAVAVKGPSSKFRPYLRMAIPNPEQQAPIANVRFFLGDADKDEKTLEKASIEGVFDRTLKAWVAKEDVLVPPDAALKIDLGVRVATETGVYATKRKAIRVLSEKDVAKEPTSATVRGLITRSGLPQPDTDVTLSKKKATKDDDPPQKVKTNDQGQFELKEVPPGTYIIFAKRGNVRGVLEVTVPKGKDLVEGQNVILGLK